MVAASQSLETLRKRAEFLAVSACGKRWVAPDFILQIGAPHEPSSSIRFGLTATRKIGNAVIRNRARRRLRALASKLLVHASPEHDYVLIARATTASCSFTALQDDMTKGLKRLKLWRDA